MCASEGIVSGKIKIMGEGEAVCFLVLMARWRKAEKLFGRPASRAPTVGDRMAGAGLRHSPPLFPKPRLSSQSHRPVAAEAATCRSLSVNPFSGFWFWEWPSKGQARVGCHQRV